MKLRAWLIAILLLLPTPSFAQGMIDPSPQSVSALDAGTACSVANSCASWNISGAPSVTMQIVGTFSGTLTFEATADGQTWFSVTVTKLSGATTSTTTTTTGQFSLTNTGVQGFRARMTSFSSGGANISLTRGTASARGGTLPQDLSTTGTPQFAREGLGVAAGSTALLTLLSGGVIAPSADATAAWCAVKSDGTTVIFCVDSTNKQIIGPSGATFPITSNGATAMRILSNSGTSGLEIGASGGMRHTSSTANDILGNFNPLGYQLNGALLCNSTAPTRSSGFGTNADASFATGSTSCAFDLNIGTGGSPTSGVLNMPTAAHGWICNVRDITTPADQTYTSAYTTATVTLTTTIAWTAGDHIYGTCTGF